MFLSKSVKIKPFLLILILGFSIGRCEAQDSLKSNGTIPILGWWGIPPEETTIARYTEMREAGFTHNFTFFSNAAQVQAALDIAQAVGMKIIISCGELGSDPENTVRRFMNHPALGGYFLRDEPNRSDFPALGQWAKRIQAVDYDHFCYLNLLPNYASTKQMGTSTYREYVNTFIKEVPLQILSYDNYPITGDSIHSMRTGYYDNLEIFADEAKKAGKPFWAFAMATAIKGAYPIPTTAELRMQMFSDLAYGAQGLQFFTYWTPPCGAECFHDGPIYNNERTGVYYKVKQVSEEIKGLSGVFLGSKVVSVRHTGEVLPQGTVKLSEVPKQIKVLETTGEGAVVSVLQRDSLAFLAVVNRNYQQPMKLIIKGDSSIRQVLKNGVLSRIDLSRLTTIDVEAGDMVVFTWPKGDSLEFVPVKKLKVYLPLDYDLKDISGNNFHAVNGGATPISFVEDNVRGKVAFFSKAAHAVLPFVEELKTSTGDFTYSFWIKCAAASGTPVIMGNTSPENEAGKGFAMALTGGKTWMVNFSDGNGKKITWTASENGVKNIADDRWHQIAVSCERNGKMDIYLDGKLQPGSSDMSSCPGSAYDEANRYPITLMQDGTGSNPDDLSGFLDDVRFWDRPFSASEIADCYLADLTVKSSEIVYLPLDNDLKDASGNSLDARDAGTKATVFVNDAVRGRVAYFEKAAYAVFPKANLLRFGTRDFSFSLWIKCSPASYTPVILGNKNWSIIGAVRKKGFVLYTNESNSAKGSLWSINIGDGEIEEGGSGNGLRWNAKENGATTISDDNWHFVAVSFDRDKTMDVYLDGALLAGSPSLAGIPGNYHDDVNDYPLTLMQDPTGKFFMDIPAYLDELRIWNRTLTPGEVTSLYNYGLSTEIPEKISGSSTGVKVWPNPATDQVTLLINSKDDRDATIRIYTAKGTLVKSLTHSLHTGQNQVNFNLGGFSTGVYLIRVISGDNSETARLILKD